MKKFTMILILVGIGVLVFWAQSRTSAKNICSDKDTSVRCSCGPVIDGLQYCAAVKAANEDSRMTIALRGSLTNVSEKRISVYKYVRGDYYFPYEIRITYASGKKVLSKREIDDEEQAKKPPQQRTVQIPMNVWGESKELAPNESIIGSLDLGQYYSFDQKGTYEVEILYKVRTLDDQKWKQFSSGAISMDVE